MSFSPLDKATRTTAKSNLEERAKRQDRSLMWALSVLLQIGLVTLALSANLSCQSASKNYAGHGAESVDPKTLSKFAAPALPTDLSRQIQSYQDLIAPGMGVLHPLRDEVYFSWRVTGVPQVWRLRKGQFPVQLTGGEDPTGLYSITPDGKYLVVSRDRGGEENPGLYLMKPEGGELMVIQHKPKVQTEYEFISENGQYIYFRSNDVDPESYALYRYQISGKKIEKLFDQKGTWSIADHRPNGQLLLARAVTNIASEYFDFDPKTKALTPVLGQGEEVAYSVAYARKSGEYIVRTSKFSEFHRLYRFVPSVSSGSGKWNELSPKSLNWDVEDFAQSRDGRYLTYMTNENGYMKLKMLNMVDGSQIRLPDFKGATQVFSGQWSWDNTRVMLGVETSKSPRVSYSYHIPTGRLDQWVLPSTPEIDTSLFVEARVDSYKARDGVSIPMVVFEPPSCSGKASKPCPVVVHFHGGPEAQSQPGFDLTAQMFVARGFVYIEPNVRGSDGYGKTWLAADNQEKRWDVITDLEDAATEARKRWSRGGVVPKVGVMGGSYGGYATLFAMTYFAGAYDAGVSNVGMSSLLTFIQNTAPYRRHLRTPEYGDPAKHGEIMKKLSPITHLDRVKAPVLIIQGANDPRVPVGESIQMFDAMKSRGLESQLIVFADEGHGASKRSNRVLERGHTIQFFEKHLK